MNISYAKDSRRKLDHDARGMHWQGMGVLNHDIEIAEQYGV